MNARSARIRDLNDAARTSMGIGCTLLQTQGINALPPAVQSTIREQVETFNEFDKDNDPYGEHDFGAIEVAVDGIMTTVFWKIDYYDRACEYGSEDPSDPSQTRRVLTIMLASEY